VPIKHGDTFISETRSINDKGQVVGEIYTEELNWQPTTAIWQRDAEIRLFYTEGFHSPYMINDFGMILGDRGHTLYEHDSSPSYYDAYVWSEESGYQYISTAHLHEAGALPIVRPAGLSNTGFAV